MLLRRQHPVELAETDRLAQIEGLSDERTSKPNAPKALRGVDSHFTDATGPARGFTMNTRVANDFVVALGD